MHVSLILIFVLCLMIITSLRGETSEETTSTSCPIRPETDLRGPPGVPGRQGPAGFGK